MTDEALPAAQPGTLTESRHAGENCRSCGGRWFGEVAYCPYCGRSASSPLPTAMEASTAVDAPPEAVHEWSPATPTALGADARSWRDWATPLAAGALVGVTVVLVVALVAGDWQAFKGAVRAPRADMEPTVQQPAPPTRDKDAQRP